MKHRSKTEPAESEKVNIAVPRTTFVEIKRMADDETRSIANMIRVLLDEAILARHDAEIDATQS